LNFYAVRMRQGMLHLTIYVLRFTLYNPHMTNTETAYNLALDYLYSFVDYSLKHASELAKADFSLDRMFALMDALGNPQAKYPVIHVAGTKGKGSTSALCASALRAAGYKVGLYTSPHLENYCERIQIDGTPLAHGQLVALVDEVKPAVARIPKLTTFEITTAIGFLAFAKQNVDAAVVEVGLGGRLDATNVVTPRVSVITSLSMDHMAVLGDTLAKIAGEKAGIIKEGVPVVSAPQKEEALEVLLCIAGEKNAPITIVGQDVKFELLSSSLDGQSFVIHPTALSGVTSEARNAVEGQVRGTTRAQETRPSTAGVPSAQDGGLKVTIPLLGSHQLVNAATAYAALKASGLAVSDESIQKGFSQVKWPARFEVARREPPVIFDSAHNDDSFSKLRETLETYFPGRQAYLIFGASEDKNIPGMFREMKPKIRKLIVTRADHPRALEVEKIQSLADQAQVPHEAVTPVEAALARALELSAKDGSIVLSAGSMFVTAEVMAAWKKLSLES
jgi:dihydrofolate synthase/folylpolyglutamate synthase